MYIPLQSFATIVVQWSRRQPLPHLRGHPDMVITASMASHEFAFIEQIGKYRLQFADERDFFDRYKIFADNVDAIDLHNGDPTATYQLGINRFSHLTFSEFRAAVGLDRTATYLFGKKKWVEDDDRDVEDFGLELRGISAATTVAASAANTTALPAAVDWVTSGAVTAAKNQGQCGSCWAFSTTGALEGAYAIKYGMLKSFSEQELVSCDATDNACDGGWMDNAFQWVSENGGLVAETEYPYVATAAECDMTGLLPDAKVAPKTFVDVAAGNVAELMAAVARQPVSIAIEANQPAFQSYSGGVLTGRCGRRLDHGVLLVGYGTTADGIDYWKVKNSWGTDWGVDGGYILIERSDADLCGVLDAASYPVL